MSEWQPIETAPKTGVVVILGHPGSASETAAWYGDGNVPGWYSEDSWKSQFNSWVAFPPTHWMPLPEPPK